MYIYILVYIYIITYIYNHIYIYICSHSVGNLRDYDYGLPISTAGPTKKPYEVPVIVKLTRIRFA